MSQIYAIEWGYQRTLNILVQKSPHLTAFNFWSISCIVLWVTWNTHRKTQTGIDVKNNEKLTWLRNPDYRESNQNQSKSNKQNWETTWLCNRLLLLDWTRHLNPTLWLSLRSTTTNSEYNVVGEADPGKVTLGYPTYWWKSFDHLEEGE